MIDIKIIYDFFKKNPYRNNKIPKKLYNQLYFISMFCHPIDFSFEEFKERFKGRIRNGRICEKFFMNYMRFNYRRDDVYVQKKNLLKALNEKSIAYFSRNRRFGAVKKIWLEYIDLLSFDLVFTEEEFNKFLEDLGVDVYKTRRTTYINLKDFCEKIDYRPGAKRYR